MENKIYNFKCGIEATQNECTYKQSKNIIKTAMKLNVQNVADLKLADIFNHAMDSDIMLEFVDIVLKPGKVPAELKKDGVVDWSELTVNELIEVGEDFFTFNQKLKSWLKTGKTGQVFTQLGNDSIN